MSNRNTHPFPPEAAHKRMIALRYWLQGAKCYNALLALDYNRSLFSGDSRKDGSPAFDHHVFQANFLRCFESQLMFFEETLALTMFHDSSEDKGISSEEIESLYRHDVEFGRRVAHSNHCVTKTFRGVKVKSEEALFEKMANDPISSVMKGVDRIHNQQSMFPLINGNPIFSFAKQREYLAETEDMILPMIKKAELRFPIQEPVYKHIRMVLKMQVQMIRHHLDVVAPQK